MKTTNNILSLVLILFAIITTALISTCTSSRVPVDEVAEQIYSNPSGKGPALEIEMIRGEGHNHPLMAIWVEDQEGNYLQTLYVAESIAKGVFGHGDASEGFWQPGEIQRPAALPYWGHKRGMVNEYGNHLPSPTSPVPDAYTGPTPGKSFLLETRLDKAASGPFTLLFEINQTWDWNEYWTNNKYPDDEEYKTSCQPALVYSIDIDPGAPKEEYIMEILGRSHHSGASGELFTDLETMSTALHIVEEIRVRPAEN